MDDPRSVNEERHSPMWTQNVMVLFVLMAVLFVPNIAARGKTQEDKRPYVRFPALVFSGRQLERTEGGARITLRGRWHNLAPRTVTYDVRTLSLIHI